MKLTKEQKRISELEAALYAAELKLERLEEAEETVTTTTSGITVKPVELQSFRQFNRAIDDAIASSQYLSTGQTDALSELRWMVIHCRTPQMALGHEKQLMRTKATGCSATTIGQLARDVSMKSVLGSAITQLAVFNALFELDRIQASGEMDIQDFLEDLELADASSILANSNAKLSDLIALRKARVNGSFEQIESVINTILDGEDDEQ